MELPVSIRTLSLLERLKCIHMRIKKGGKAAPELLDEFMHQFRDLTRGEAGSIVGELEERDTYSLVLFMPKAAPRVEVLVKAFKKDGTVSIIADNFAGKAELLPLAMLEEIIKVSVQIENLHESEIEIVGTVTGEGSQEGKIPDVIRQYVFGKLKIGY
jgi:hypothetical protein